MQNTFLWVICYHFIHRIQLLKDEGIAETRGKKVFMRYLKNKKTLFLWFKIWSKRFKNVHTNNLICTEQFITLKCKTVTFGKYDKKINW